VTSPASADAHDLVALDDDSFRARWRGMSDAERLALPDEVRSRAVARYRELTPHIGATIVRLEREQQRADREASRPAHTDIDGAVLLDFTRDFIGRFVAFPSEHCLNAVTLWAAHAHTVNHFHTSPRLAVLSPEPESGKTRTLEVLDLLAPNSMLIFSPSVAAIFRKLADEQVTLLFDEVDTIFTRRGKDDSNEDLRAMLNAGYRKGAAIPRCVGPQHQVENFRVFAAVALAGIGDLPETVMTRSIVIRMRRRSATEQVEQFRLRVHQQEGYVLRDRLAAWGAAIGPAAGVAWPALPDGVTDRKAEVWEPLIALADAAGGDWPARARAAAVSFVTDVSLAIGVSASLGIRLLADLRQVFEGRETMATTEILDALVKLEESPWADLHGRALNARGLATRLGRYGVTRRQVRLGERTAKGYRREDLHDAWVRYLPPSLPLEKETSETKGNADDGHDSTPPLASVGDVADDGVPI
jgi:hypothetical protein